MKDYSSKRYQLGIAEQASQSHPWGKGAEKRYSATGLVNHAERKGFSDKYIAKKAIAIANLTHHTKWSEAARIARHRAHMAKQYKSDKKRMKV